MEDPIVPDATHVAPSIESPSDEHTKPMEPEIPPKSLATPPASDPDTSTENRRGSIISELTDLDIDEEDDIGEIEPDHYFDGGKIPVFKPVSFPSKRQVVFANLYPNPMPRREAMLTYVDHGTVPQLQEVLRED